MSGMGGIRFVDLSDVEIEELERRFTPLATRVRHLIDATIRTNASAEAVEAACEALDHVLAQLWDDQVDGPAGVTVSPSGRSTSWGNAVSGIRNAAAPLPDVCVEADGTAHATVNLGAACEGHPGNVHGGIAALLLDHVMGAVGSSGGRLTMTRTLGLTFHKPLPLGRVQVSARIERVDGRKVYITGHVEGAEGAAVEAEALFVIPKWFTSVDQIVADATSAGSASAGPAALVDQISRSTRHVQ